MKVDVERRVAAWLVSSFLIAMPLSASASPRDGRTYRAYLAECHANHICNGTYIVARNGKLVFLGARHRVQADVEQA